MNQTISDFQQNAENANNEGVQRVNGTATAVNRNLTQREDAVDASPPISVEWYEALIQQQRMNDEKTKTKTTGSALTEITSQTNGAPLDREGKGDEMVGELADVASTLADKMGEYKADPDSFKS